MWVFHGWQHSAYCHPLGARMVTHSWGEWKLHIWNCPKCLTTCFFLLLVDSDWFPFAIKNAVINIVLSWVLNYSNYWSWRDSQTTEFLASCPEVRLARGPLNLRLVSEVRAVLWGLCPSPVGSSLTPHSWCQKSLQKFMCMSFVKMWLRVFS